MKKSLFILFLSLSIGSSFSHAQITDVGKFFAGGVDDAELLFEGYLGPYFNAFGTSLTGGWYNTAKPHKLGGFDVTATVNTAFVPSSDRSFDVNALKLTSLSAMDNEGVSPTIAGDKDPGSQMYYNIPTNPEAFVMPKGTGVPYIPSPMLQLGIGLIKDTEVMGRFMPSTSAGDAQIGMWGLGFKHGLKQWIPFIKKIPVLHLSVQYGYTKMNGDFGFEVTPATIGAEDQTTTADWNNQRIEFITKSHTGNLIVSADLPIVCFYGGIGFASTKTDFGVKGDIPIVDPTVLPTPTVTDGSYLPDGINFQFNNTDGSITKPRYNVGMRLKFAVVTIHGDYTYANYSMFTFGLGISFR